MAKRETLRYVNITPREDRGSRYGWIIIMVVMVLGSLVL